MSQKPLLIFCSILIALASSTLSHSGTRTGEANLGISNASGKQARISSDMEEMLLFFDESELIVTATKHPQSLQDAPAIATVIKGEEIRNMGARNILDVLKRVPGFGVTKGYFGLPEIEVRGIKTTYSEKVKLLIDGHSVNNNLYGFATWSFDDLAVDNVKRIEIIRGPGSALYGSNAFSAVINVVTKDGKDIDGAVISAGGGSFNTERYKLQAGKNLGNIDAAFMFDYLNTDGAELKLDSDIIGNSGDTDDFEEKMDAGLKLAYKNWSFNSRYVAKRAGPYIGATYALNDESELEVSQFFGELAYNHDVSENSKMAAKAYIDEMNLDNYWELFPEGTTIPGYGTFADGMIGNPSVKERILGTELQSDLRLPGNNLFTVGVMYEKRKQFDVEHSTNFNPDPANNPGYSLIFDSVQDISSWGNFTEEKERNVWAGYLQDVWDVSKDITLTLGVRHDQYSDFGDTTNPRAAFVWKFSDKWDAKLLYGRAFRAPSFVELYFINNPSQLGNPDLQPEKMETYEATLGYSLNSHYSARVTYFNNLFRDKIQLISQSDGSSVFQNTGGANVQGAEIEIKKGFWKDSSLYANYTYQWATDDETGDRLADVPVHKGNVGGNFGLSRYLNANLNLFASGERTRVEGDTRNALPAYALLDMTIIGKNFYPNLEIRASSYNLLNQKYEDPSPFGTMYDDFPREGASYLIEASYKFY